MEWDLGLEGVALLAAMSVGFGVAGAVFVDGVLARRAWAGVITTVACFVVGLLTSEVLFGWATEEDLQPNVDGLSRDEVLLAGFLTTVVVVVVMRHLPHRTRHRGLHLRHS